MVGTWVGTLREALGRDAEPKQGVQDDQLATIATGDRPRKRRAEVTSGVATIRAVRPNRSSRRAKS